MNETLRRRALTVLVTFVMLVGPGSEAAVPDAPAAAPTPEPAPPRPASETLADLAFCVPEVNRVRSQNGRARVAHSAALEAFAMAGAKADAMSAEAHGHYRTANGAGLGMWENEFPAQRIGSVHLAIRALNELSVAEGPTGGHYQNLLGPRTELGCGAYAANGLVTLVLDFR